jgi:hypothetical protein
MGDPQKPFSGVRGILRIGRVEWREIGWEGLRFEIGASKLLNNSITFVFYLFKSLPPLPQA